MKKTNSMLYPVKRHFKISKAMVRVTPEALSATEVLSASTVKRLAIEQGRFLKRQWQEFQRNFKLQVFILKLKVANCKLNLEL